MALLLLEMKEERWMQVADMTITNGDMTNALTRGKKGPMAGVPNSAPLDSSIAICAYYPSLSEGHLELVYKKLYNSLLEALDAVDTGVEMALNGVELLYHDTTGSSSRMGRLNPRWNEVDANGESPNPDRRFAIASSICGEDFLAVMTKIAESDIPARYFVERAVLERKENDPSGEILKLSSWGLPWRGHLYELEKEHAVDPLIKFVLYTDQGGMWRIQAATVEGKAFENKLSLPEEWSGVRVLELCQMAMWDRLLYQGSN
jgi:uncharacterized UPF0160 family protein